MPYLNISKRYIDTLKKYLIVLKHSPTKEALFFKKDGLTYVSKYNESNNLWVNFAAPAEDMDFDLEELAICNIDELLNYLEAIKYPDPDSSVTYKTVSGKNSQIELQVLEIKGKIGKYYLPLANPGIFVQKYDRKVPVAREKDPTELKAKFRLSKDDIDSLTTSINMLGIVQSIGIGVFDDIITIYAKGNSNQQFEYELDSNNVKVFGNYTTAESSENGGCKIFPMDFLSSMQTFGTDFDVELRTFTAPNGKMTTTLKAFGKIDNLTYHKKTKNGEKPADSTTNIELLLGVTENVAVSVTGLFDVMKSKALK